MSAIILEQIRTLIVIHHLSRVLLVFSPIHQVTCNLQFLSFRRGIRTSIFFFGRSLPIHVRSNPMFEEFLSNERNIKGEEIRGEEEYKE